MTMLGTKPMAARPPARATAPVLGMLTRKSVRPTLVLHAVEGFGKTTTAAYAPNSAILMARGEAGYATLLNAGRAPERLSASVDNWSGLLTMLDEWNQPAVEWLALDAMGGFERLCHEHVCQRDFDGNWGEKGFASFQKGFDVSIAEWLLLLQKLERINSTFNTGILLLGHTRIRNFKNPMGPDFDRYIADTHEKTWGVTGKWADAVLFGTFQTVTEQDRQTKKFKGIGGTQRILYTERTDAYDAKNRFGMAPALLMPDDPAQMWGAIAQAMAGTPAAAPVDEIPV